MRSFISVYFLKFGSYSVQNQFHLVKKDDLIEVRSEGNVPFENKGYKNISSMNDNLTTFTPKKRHLMTFLLLLAPLLSVITLWTASICKTLKAYKK